MKSRILILAILLVNNGFLGCNRYNYLKEDLHSFRYEFNMLISQKNGSKWINRTTIDSLKVGLWFYHDNVSECYINNKKYRAHIPFECLHFDSIGCYDEGNKIGNWYYFNQERCIRKAKFKKKGLPNLKLYEVDSIFKQGKYRNQF